MKLNALLNLFFLFSLTFLLNYCASKGLETKKDNLDWQKKYSKEFFNYEVKESWLIEQLSFIEFKEQIRPYLNDGWSKTHFIWFINQYEQSDEIWRFANPTEMWDVLEGVRGYVLIRKGTQIATLIRDTNNIEMFLILD